MSKTNEKGCLHKLYDKRIGELNLEPVISKHKTWNYWKWIPLHF